MDEQIEMYMAQLVQTEAPEDVAEFLAAIQEDGITAEEVDEVRQITMATLNDPTMYPQFAQYLVSAELIEANDIPQSYDAGFVLSVLGLVGVAQQIVAPR
jgi:hypothetical protein